VLELRRRLAASATDAEDKLPLLQGGSRNPCRAQCFECRDRNQADVRFQVVFDEFAVVEPRAIPLEHVDFNPPALFKVAENVAAGKDHRPARFAVDDRA